MNREVIKANKEAFDWWLKTGERVWRKDTPSQEWMLVFPDWIYKTYVPNDEYAEFRKAQADGKIIETMDCEGTWIDMRKDWKSCGFNPKQKYRIKPDEPKFKVGDYVVRTDGSSIWLVNEINYDNTNCSLKGMYYPKSIVDLTKNYKLWTLEEASDDEWVAYWCEGDTGFTVDKKTSDITWFNGQDYVKPYIGQTPEQLGF